MTHALFAYGTLQASEVMYAITGRHFPAQTAQLLDHACYALREYTYPGLRRQPGSIATGVLYEGMAPRDLARLDAFEDDFYHRQTLTVRTATTPRVAEVYVVRDEHIELLDAHPWDFEHFRTADLKEFLNHYRNP